MAPVIEKGDESLIHPDIFRTCIVQSVKHGGKAEWETALRMYRKPPTPTHKIAALMALGSTRDPELIKQAFDFTFVGNEVKTQDFMYPILALATNVATRRQLRDAMQERHEKLVKRFEGSEWRGAMSGVV